LRTLVHLKCTYFGNCTLQPASRWRFQHAASRLKTKKYAALGETLALPVNLIMRFFSLLSIFWIMQSHPLDELLSATPMNVSSISPIVVSRQLRESSTRRESIMPKRKIHITDSDMQRLRKLLEGTRYWNQKDREYLSYLEQELDRAVLVPSEKVPANVVTMNSLMRVKDLDSEKEMAIRLVYPGEADFERGKISILAPIGTALIGYRAGDTVEWKVPSGTRRLRIEEITYQPEAAGDYHL
jgi:regulator of nucleoside diphosphate kinase